MLVAFADLVSEETHAQAAGVGAGPVAFGHFHAIGAEPVDVLDVRAVDGAALKKMPSPEDGLLAAQFDERPDELEEAFLLVVENPIDPGDFVVLAIGVVVSLLGATEFIPRKEHGNALREEQGGQEIPPLAGAQVVDSGIFRGALRAAVPAVVRVAAVLVSLSVGLVVFLIVANQIGEREAVMAGHKIQARAWAAAIVEVEIAASGKA